MLLCVSGCSRAKDALILLNPEDFFPVYNLLAQKLNAEIYGLVSRSSRLYLVGNSRPFLLYFVDPVDLQTFELDFPRHVSIVSLIVQESFL
jgi:hypothetical protein